MDRKGIPGRLPGWIAWSRNTGRHFCCCGLERGMPHFGQAEFYVSGVRRYTSKYGPKVILVSYNFKGILVWVPLDRSWDKDQGAGSLFGRWSLEAQREKKFVSSQRFHFTGERSEKLCGICFRIDSPRGWASKCAWSTICHPSLVNVWFVLVLPKEIRILTRHNDIHSQRKKSCMLSYVGICWRHCRLLIKMVSLGTGNVWFQHTVGRGASTGKEKSVSSVGALSKVRQRSMLTVRNSEPVVFVLKFPIPSPRNGELQI